MDTTALDNAEAAEAEVGKVISRTGRNAAFLAGSFLAQAVSQVLLLSMIGRLGGVEKAGIWSYIVAFTDPFLVLIDFGTTRFLVPEIARHPTESDTLLGNAITLGLMISLPALLTLAVIANMGFLHHSSTTINAIYLAALAMVLSNAAMSIRSAFRAFDRFDLEALNEFLIAAVLLVSAFVILAFEAPFLWLFAALVLDELAGLIHIWFLYNRHLGRVKLQHNFAMFRHILAKSWIFMSINLLYRAYMRIDILILTYLQGAVATGYYGLVTALFYRLDVITRLLTTSILPSMSRAYVKRRSNVGRYLDLATKAQILLGLPLAVGGVALAPQIINFLYGRGYETSALIFQLLITAVLLRFINRTFGVTLTAMDLQHWLLVALGLATSLNIAINFLLIPRWSAIGATVTSMASEVILFALAYWFLPANTRQSIRWNAMVKPFISALIMAIPLYFVRGWPLPVALLLGAVVYIFALFVLRTFSREETKALVQLLGSIRVVPAPLQSRLAALMLSRAHS